MTKLQRLEAWELKMGALAVDADGYVWQLWTFDARPHVPMMWFRYDPVMLSYPGNSGGTWVAPKDLTDYPGEVIWAGDGGWRK
jgi:hypothetical protein